MILDSHLTRSIKLQNINAGRTCGFQALVSDLLLPLKKIKLLTLFFKPIYFLTTVKLIQKVILKAAYSFKKEVSRFFPLF